MTQYQIMPDLTPEEYEALKADIAENGVQVQVEYDDDENVLDGHHRLRACQELGITHWPKIVRRGLSESGKRIHVFRLNVHRRHLTTGQKAMGAAALLPDFAELAKERQRVHGGTAPGRPKSAEVEGKDTESLVELFPQVFGKASEEAAATAGVNRHYVSDAARLLEQAPEIAGAVAQGLINIPQAKMLEKLPEEQRVEAVERVRAGDTVTEARWQTRKKAIHAAPLAEGFWHVLYADPPWEYGKVIDNYGPADRHYATMSVKELCDLKIDERPVADLVGVNGALFLWATSPGLENGLALLRAWGFDYKASFVWDKVKHNFGNYQSVRHEFLLLGIRGSYPLENQHLFDSVVTEERTEHSVKPAMFRTMIETVYPSARKLELFCRGIPSEGWDAWGAEVEP